MTLTWVDYVLLLAGFVAGGLPIGYWIGKAYGHDVRVKGSRNIGATNVGRVVGENNPIAGKKAYVLTLLLDTFKGFLPVLLATFTPHHEWLPAAVGMAAVLSHCIQPFLRRAGGKGASTFFGVGLVINPLVAVLAFVIQKIVTRMTRFVSLGTISAAITFGTLTAYFCHNRIVAGLVLWTMLVVIVRHAGNIANLIQGKENKALVKEKKPKPPAGCRMGTFGVHQTQDDADNTKARLVQKFWLFDFMTSKFLHEKVRPRIPLRFLGMGQIVISAIVDGEEVFAGLDFAGAPYLPREMKGENEARAVGAFTKAIALSLRRFRKWKGGGVVGLGAYFSIIGRGGLDVAVKFFADHPVTTGNGYTTGTGIRAILDLAARVGHRLNRSTAMVIGATGAIGRAASLMLAEHVAEIILVGRDPSDWRLIKLAQEINAAGKCHARVGTLEDLGSAHLVVSATSKDSELDIDPGKIRKGAVVCDLARPRDIAKKVVEARRGEILVIDGGIIRVPKLVYQTWDFGFGKDGVIFACMAETLILLLKKVDTGLYSFPEITLEWIDQLLKWGDELGFTLAGYRSLDVPLSDDEIQDFAIKVAVEGWAAW